MSDDLKKKTIAGFGWALGGQLTNQISGFVISLILARLLTPEEFGLASLVLVVNLVGTVFLDAGISAGLIRKKHVDDKELSSFFYLNIILGLSIMAIIIISSELISDLFETTELKPLLQLSSIQFFISSFGLMPMVLLKREIDFKFITKLDAFINIGSGFVTIILAILGFGVYSLIFRSIISGIINVAFLWRKIKWRPSWIFSLKSIKDTFSYSTGILGLGVIDTISKNFGTILIGKFFSVSTIGIFDRAKNTRGLILRNFGPLFNKVFFPVLSKIQDDEVRLQSYYLRAIQMVSLLTVYSMSILFLFSDTLIYYLYGNQWMEAAPILKVISLAGLVLPISNINLNLFMVKGESRFLMFYELGKHILSALIMTVAITFGMYAFLYSLVGIAYLFFIMNITLTFKKFKFSLKAQLYAFLSKLLPALIILPFFEYFFLAKGVSLKFTLIAAPIFTIGYFGIAFFMDRKLYYLIRNIIDPNVKKLRIKLLKNSKGE